MGKLKQYYTLINKDIDISTYNENPRKTIINTYHKNGLYCILFKAKENKHGRYNIITLIG